MGTMEKVISVSIDFSPDDIANAIADADNIEQEVILYKLAKMHYNHPGQFLMQLQNISDSIKADYSHDVRNMIKRMINDINAYLGEEV